MEEKVLHMEAYSSALIELELFLSGEDLNQKFAALEVEDELQALKAQLHKESVTSETPDSNIEAEVVSLTTQLRETWKCVHTLKGHLAGVNAIAINFQGNTLMGKLLPVVVPTRRLDFGDAIQQFYPLLLALMEKPSPVAAQTASSFGIYTRENYYKRLQEVVPLPLVLTARP